MSRLFKRRGKKIGVPPGTLVHVGELHNGKVSISLVDYDQRRLLEKENPPLQDCLSSMNDATVTWIHVGGVHEPDVIAAIGKQLKLHPLMMEDILNTGQRPKLDDYRDYIYIVARALRFNEDKKEIEDEQVSIVLGKHFVISFSERSQNMFTPIRDRIRKEQSRFRASGPDYLAYAILDQIVDHYFVILEKVDDELESLDTALMNNPNHQILGKIQHAKREMTLLRKWIWPMREVMSNFMRIDSPLITNNTKLYARDVHDHAMYAIETIEGFRDIVSGMIDIYLTTISQRLNEIIKVLTIVATIFVPLTFISSLYGMNFDHMPELHWHFGYPYALALMALSALGMLYFFRKKKWI